MRITIRSCGRPSALASTGRIRALPLIAGMDLEDAVLFEGERVDRLELDVEHAARRIGLLKRRTARARKAASRPGSSTSRTPPFGSAICFAPWSRTSCSETFAPSPAAQSTLTRSAARIAAG